MNSEQAIIFASSLISKLDNINFLDTVKKELPKTRCFTQTQRKSLEVNIKIINKMKTDDEFIDFLRYTRDIYFEDKGYLFHENDIEFDIEKYDLNYEEIYDLIYHLLQLLHFHHHYIILILQFLYTNHKIHSK